MTGRDALGVACVLWPGLRVPLALADAASEALGRFGEVSGEVRTASSAWGLGVIGERDLGRTYSTQRGPKYVATMWLGPFVAEVAFTRPYVEGQPEDPREVEAREMGRALGRALGAAIKGRELRTDGAA